MELKFGRHNQVYRSPSASSSSIYTNFTDHAREEGLWRRSVNFGGRLESLRELEKTIIREEILEEEAERRRILEAEVRWELMMEREMMATQGRPEYSSPVILPPPHSHRNRFQSEFHSESGSLEAVSFQGRLQSPEITDRNTSLQQGSQIGLEKPYRPTPSEAKRKRRPPPSIPSGAKPKRRPPTSPAASCSTDACNSSKEKANMLSCALCKVTTTSKLDLEDHLAGKRHLKKLRKSGQKSSRKSSVM